jgi:hypothetical protein
MYEDEPEEAPPFPDPGDPAFEAAVGPGYFYEPTSVELLELAERGPADRLMRYLSGIDISALSADEALTFVQQTQRLVSFAAGLHAHVLASANQRLVDHFAADNARSLAEARRVNAERAEAGLPPCRSTASFAPPELAARNELAPALRLAPQTMDVALGHAAALSGPWRPMLAALLAGELTDAHTKAIGRALEGLPSFGFAEQEEQYAAECAEILDVVLPYARTHTPGECRVRTENRVLATDPVGARHRRRTAAEDEHGVFLTDTEPGTCQITAVMPKAHGEVLMAAVNTLARDERFETAAGCITLGQRRVAALVELTLGSPGTVGEVTGPVAETKINAHISVVVPLESLLTQDEGSAQGGQINGTIVGPDVLRELVADAGDLSTVRRLLAAADGTIVDIGRRHYSPTSLQRILIRLRDSRCRFPGCRARAERCEIDHCLSWNDGGHTDLCNLGLLCKRHHQAKTHGGWRITRSFRDGRCRWRSPLGRIYEHEPPPLLPPGPRRSGGGTRPPSVPDDDPPPF